MVLSQTSARLKEQIALAMDTAMPTLLLTKIAGKVVGKSTGSVVVLS